MKYDLLIQHGEVIDPAAGLRGMLDVGVSGGKVVAVAPGLAASQAHRTISAKGLLVTPGLIDIHAHVFVNAHDMGGHTDHFCQASGVTTLCDAGSTGSANFRISPMPTPRAALARSRRTPIWRSGSSCAMAPGSCGNTPPSR